MPNYGCELPEVVIVTGASSGLGLACALELTRTDCEVIGVDLASRADELTGAGYRHVSGEVQQEEIWEEVGRILDRGDYGSIGFIGAAGMLRSGTLLDGELSDWRAMWEVNVLGNVLGTRSLLPRMLGAEWASAVWVSSVDARFGEQGLAAYSSSKAAIEGAARAIALDHAPSQVRINVLQPGAMLGGIFARHLASAPDPEALLADRVRRQPLGRIVEPVEVARVAAFMLSREAGAMVGSTVVVDGGLTAGFDYLPEHETRA